MLIVGIAASKAQTLPTIDTAYHFDKAARITPIRAKFNDTTNVNHISVRTEFDDFKTRAVYTWYLMDTHGNISLVGSVAAEGTDYAALLASTNPLFPYVLVARALNITYVNP